MPLRKPTTSRWMRSSPLSPHWQQASLPEWLNRVRPQPSLKWHTLPWLGWEKEVTQKAQPPHSKWSHVLHISGWMGVWLTGSMPCSLRQVGVYTTRDWLELLSPRPTTIFPGSACQHDAGWRTRGVSGCIFINQTANIRQECTIGYTWDHEPSVGLGKVTLEMVSLRGFTVF